MQCKLPTTYHSSPVGSPAWLKEESLLYTQQNSPGKEHFFPSSVRKSRWKEKNKHATLR